MKITKAHFELYKKEFRSWVDFWGLKDFHYTFYLENLEMSYSEVRVVFSGRRYEVYLNAEIPDEEFEARTVNEFMKQLAFHECCECLLAGVREMASSRTYDEEVLDREVHGIINRLQNAIQFNHEIAK